GGFCQGGWKTVPKMTSVARSAVVPGIPGARVIGRGRRPTTGIRSDRTQAAAGRRTGPGQGRRVNAVKGSMNRTTVPHADEPPRPLIVRAAHRWYSWAAVAVTVAGSYLAVNGQFRIGEGARLQAAPPDSSSSNWKPSGAPAAESDKITLTPGPVADDP